MTIQFAPAVQPSQPLVTARPVEIPLESRQIAAAAVPPARNTYAQRDEQQNRTERERDDRKSDAQSSLRSRGSQVDISV